MTKRVLILANSIKKNARCVAGREYFKDGSGFRLGDWVRPVSSLREGELLPKHFINQNSVASRVLDVVDMDLLSNRADQGQPENWLIASRNCWRLVETMKNTHRAALEESPQELWLVPGTRPDRINVDDQARRIPQHSLVVVRPEQFRIRLWSDTPPWLDHIRRNTKAVFTYAGSQYAMSVTDPIFTHKYCSKHPAEGDEAVEISPPCGDNCLLCISLTPPFKGYHYKVVATVLDLT